jgi:hypothetical protein
MQINNTIKYVFLGTAIFFQLYLAYASTLYLAWGSLSFYLVALTAVASVIVISYYVCVVSEQDKVNESGH